MLKRHAHDNCNGYLREKPRGRMLRYSANMTAQVGYRTQDPYGMRDSEGVSHVHKQQTEVG